MEKTLRYMNSAVTIFSKSSLIEQRVFSFLLNAFGSSFEFCLFGTFLFHRMELQIIIAKVKYVSRKNLFVGVGFLLLLRLQTFFAFFFLFLSASFIL